VHITVVGAGSMGCLLGGYLAEAGHSVYLLDVLEDRVVPIREHGLGVEGVRGDFEVAAQAGVSYTGPPPDLVLVCVKAFDTERAAAVIRTFLGEATVVLTVQNGLGNVEQLSRCLPREQILIGTTALGATLLRPGRVLHAGDGETVVGELGGSTTGRAQQVARILSEARIETHAVTDVEAHVWTKLAVNSGINALTALLRLRNGRLLETPAEHVMELAVRECAAVAERSGIKLDGESLVHRTKEVARLTASNRSSMLADVLAGRRTEIDAINGAVARRGRELGLPVPVNETLTAIVQSLEVTRDVQER
jgi:2-dehydropantoate 2-reductase